MRGWLGVWLMLMAAPVAAQTTITVLGVGSVAMDLPGLTAAQALAQGYRAYVPATSTTPIALTVTCTGSAPALCTFPIAALNLPVAQARSLAVTATLVAADGLQESVKVVAPFLLLVGAPAVAPTYSATPIRPPSP